MSNEIITGRDVLRLLADGVSFQELECRTVRTWETLTTRWSAFDLFNSTAQFRRKPKTRVINGFTVPEPVREGLQRGQEFYFVATACREWCVRDTWVGLDVDCVRLQRGLIFYDREAAIATAKAMCGIDPNKEN